MIVVAETDHGIERIGGNPVLTSLDGEVRAPLLTILHESWTDEERARFGVHLAEPFELPAGKVAVGSPRYEKVNGKVVELVDVTDAPEPDPTPTPLDLFRVELDALAARVKALEDKP